MSEQNLANHAKLVTPFHKVLLPVILLTIIGSFVNLFHSLNNHSNLYSASLICAMSICLIGAALAARVFALGAQDRAIRAEERFRYYILTGGKMLDSRLTLKQIVALRFASDAEFAELANKAAEKGLSNKEIKAAIKTWKADNERV